MFFDKSVEGKFILVLRTVHVISLILYKEYEKPDKKFSCCKFSSACFFFFLFQRDVEYFHLNIRFLTIGY